MSDHHDVHGSGQHPRSLVCAGSQRPRPNVSRRLAVLWLALSMLAPVIHAQTVNDGYAPIANGDSHAMLAQRDGKLLVAGAFSQINGQPCPHLCRLLPDGSVDPAFADANASDDVLALALQGDGKILVGGKFSLLGGQFRNRVGRLNGDGTLDAHEDSKTRGQIL